MIKLTYAKLMQEQRTLRELESQFNKQKKLVESIREEMLAELHEAGTDSYKAELGSISVIKTEVPVVKDWEAFYDFIIRNNSPELLQRRVSTAAWREWLEEDDVDQVPGVETFNKETLRITLKK